MIWLISFVVPLCHDMIWLISFVRLVKPTMQRINGQMTWLCAFGQANYAAYQWTHDVEQRRCSNYMLFFKGLITFVWSVCLVYRWWTCAFWPGPAQEEPRPGHAHIPPGRHALVMRQLGCPLGVPGQLGCPLGVPGAATLHASSEGPARTHPRAWACPATLPVTHPRAWACPASHVRRPSRVP